MEQYPHSPETSQSSPETDRGDAERGDKTKKKKKLGIMRLLTGGSAEEAEASPIGAEEHAGEKSEPESKPDLHIERPFWGKLLGAEEDEPDRDRVGKVVKVDTNPNASENPADGRAEESEKADDGASLETIEPAEQRAVLTSLVDGEERQLESQNAESSNGEADPEGDEAVGVLLAKTREQLQASEGVQAEPEQAIDKAFEETAAEYGVGLPPEKPGQQTNTRQEDDTGAAVPEIMEYEDPTEAADSPSLPQPDMMVDASDNAGYPQTGNVNTVGRTQAYNLYPSPDDSNSPPPTHYGGGYMPPPPATPMFGGNVDPNRDGAWSGTTGFESEDTGYDRGAAFGGLLIGGIVGYLIGRRRGRIKTEERLGKVQRKLETQVRGLQSHLQERELQIRRLVHERVVSPNQVVNHQLQTAAEAAAPFAPKAGEKPAAVGSVAETNASHKPETDRMRPKPIDKLTMPELLAIAEVIPAGTTTLRRVYETNLISERGLRRIISEQQHGGDLRRVIAEELLIKELGHELDPILRDRPLRHAAAVSAITPPPTAAPATGTPVVSAPPAAIPAPSGLSQLTSERTAPSVLVMANVAASVVLVVLLVALAIIWLTR